MANTSMTGAELDRALRTLSNAESAENNGKLLCIQNGKIALQAPSQEE